MVPPTSATAARSFGLNDVWQGRAARRGFAAYQRPDPTGRSRSCVMNSPPWYPTSKMRDRAAFQAFRAAGGSPPTIFRSPQIVFSGELVLRRWASRLTRNRRRIFPAYRTNAIGRTASSKAARSLSDHTSRSTLMKCGPCKLSKQRSTYPGLHEDGSPPNAATPQRLEIGARCPRPPVRTARSREAFPCSPTASPLPASRRTSARWPRQ